MKKIKVRSKSGRIQLPQTLWFSIIGVLIIILIISAVTANMAYQEPTETKETYTTLTYSSGSRYSYTAYLDENTVYNKTQLTPGEGILFKKLVNNITGSHQFTFQLSQSATITTTQTIEAIIQTDLWTKTYTLVSSKSSQTVGTRHIVNEEFPINFQFFDTILSTINEETGINAPNPILIIKSSVAVTAKTQNDTIYDSFNPEITMSLNQKTIEFSETLSQQQSGARTATKTIDHPEVLQMRQTRTIITIAVLLILIIFVIIVRIKPSTLSATERQLHKIQKKYGEWIVTADTNPIDPLSKTISISTIDQLSRISEDLGKPMIHYQKNGSANIFLVIDDDHIYKHELGKQTEGERQFSLFFRKNNDDTVLENNEEP